MPSISCIIPAFNEGSRLARVLTALVDHPLLDEIIVVDDGSTDETHAAAKQFKNVRLLVQTTNIGKSGAICMGIRASASNFLLLLDADLVGLTKDDVTARAEYVRQKIPALQVEVERARRWTSDLDLLAQLGGSLDKVSI